MWPVSALRRNSRVTLPDLPLIFLLFATVSLASMSRAPPGWDIRRAFHHMSGKARLPDISGGGKSRRFLGECDNKAPSSSLLGLSIIGRTGALARHEGWDLGDHGCLPIWSVAIPSWHVGAVGVVASSGPQRLHAGDRPVSCIGPEFPAALHLHGRRRLQDRGKPAGPHRGRAGPAGSV